MTMLSLWCTRLPSVVFASTSSLPKICVGPLKIAGSLPLKNCTILRWSLGTAEYQFCFVYFFCSASDIPWYSRHVSKSR